MSIALKLREAISLWLSEKQKRSLSMLARISKVSYSTIRRIMQDETTPNTEITLKIASVVMSKSELDQFTDEHMPILALTRTKIAIKTDDDDLMELMTDTDYIPLILLASHSKGTNEKEVQNFFGHEMTYRFTEFVNSGHLNRCDDGNWKLDKDIGSVNLETARDWLKVFSSICPSANDNIAKGSAAHVGWESVNVQTAIAVYHAAIDYMRTAAKLTTEEKNRGDVLIFFGSMFNILKGQENLK